MQPPLRSKLIVNVAQIIVWAGIFLTPSLVTWTMTSSSGTALGVLYGTAKTVFPLFLVYFLNYSLLVPKCLYGSHRRWFYLINLLLITLLSLRVFFPREPIPQEVLDQFGEKNALAIYVGGIVAHDALLQAEEERRKSTEAELTWLKNQLNPHFLFNTLNNISSLTQIDPDQAQERIGQLSDTLRYALYDSEAEKVPLSGEVAFMDNYIDLMALRCSERTRVERSLILPDHEVMIAPLLFISLIENAFKHGVSARNDSLIRMDLHTEGKDLCFVCENTVFEKETVDRSGSGIGLVNLRRRLELIYPGQYTYRQSVAEGLYRVEIRLKNLL